MKILLEESQVQKIDSKKLYRKILDLFDEYYVHMIALEDIATSKAFNYSTEVREECFQKGISNPTYSAMVSAERDLEYVRKFEERLEFIKQQFTPDEEIIFKQSIIERVSDKEIMFALCKSEHKYYQIKKSCYLKIGLRFGIVRLKKEKTLYCVTQLVE